MSKAKELLKVAEDDEPYWKFNDGGDGYLLMQHGEEIGFIAADNPGSWHAYLPNEEMPFAGPFPTALEAAIEVESAAGLSHDAVRDALPSENEVEEEGEKPNTNFPNHPDAEGKMIDLAREAADAAREYIANAINNGELDFVSDEDDTMMASTDVMRYTAQMLTGEKD